ncbi:hypothetical protein BMG05_16725 [Mycobacterium malmoense]|nr:hypothetical protein BMG05_16725 [Mycobacterium malmoense]
MDKADHTLRDASDHTDNLTFADGKWRDATPWQYPQKCTLDSETSETVVFSWEFQPWEPGVFQGSFTNLVTTNSCGAVGNTTQVPLSATRVADTPPLVGPPIQPPLPIPPLPPVPSQPLQQIPGRDQQFLAEMADEAILPVAFKGASDVGTGAEYEINSAKTVCTLRLKGISAEDVAQEMAQDSKKLTLTLNQARLFIQTAERTYCPQYESNP